LKTPSPYKVETKAYNDRVKRLNREITSLGGGFLCAKICGKP